MAEGEGFALQRLPTGNAKGTIACSPDMPRCGIIRGFCPRRINKKGNGCCLFMAEGEGFALQRLPTGNARGTIACSPDMPRCGIIRGFCPRRINKKGNGCCLFMAEGEGFEPPDTFASTVFKTAAFDRSASLPCLQIIS